MNYLSELLLHIGVFLAFIATFYFTGINAMQRMSLRTDIRNAMQDFSNSLQTTTLSNPLANVQHFSYEGDDRGANQVIFTEVVVSVSIISSMLILAAVIIAWRRGDALKELLVEAVVIAITYGLAESLLLGGFVFQLINFDSQTLTKTMTNAIYFLYKFEPGYSCNQVTDTLQSMFPFIRH